MAIPDLLPLLKELLPDKLELFGYIKRNKLITLLLISHTTLVFFLLFMSEQNMLKETQWIEARREWLAVQGAVDKLADCEVDLSRAVRVEKDVSDKLSRMESNYHQLAQACELASSNTPVQQIVPIPKPTNNKPPVRNNALPPRTHPNKDKTDYQELLEGI